MMKIEHPQCQTVSMPAPKAPTSPEPKPLDCEKIKVQKCGCDGATKRSGTLRALHADSHVTLFRTVLPTQTVARIVQSPRYANVAAVRKLLGLTRSPSKPRPLSCIMPYSHEPGVHISSQVDTLKHAFQVPTCVGRISTSATQPGQMLADINEHNVLIFLL